MEEEIETLNFEEREGSQGEEEDRKSLLAIAEHSALPLLPTYGLVVFPHSVVPLVISNPEAISAIDMAVSKGRTIFCSLKKGEELNYPNQDEIHNIGTVCYISRIARLPGEPVRVILQGISRARIKRILNNNQPYLVQIELIKEQIQNIINIEIEALQRTVSDQFSVYLSMLPVPVPPEAFAFLRTIETPGKLSDIIASSLSIKPKEAQDILEMLDVTERLRKISAILIREIEVLKVQKEIAGKVREQLDKIQKEQLLREQLKAIKIELGEYEGGTKEIEELIKKVESSGMPEDAMKETIKQVRRLENMHPELAEAQVLRTWIEEVLSLPWNLKTEDNLDVKRAEKILDEDHHNLEDVKERILEFLGTAKLKKGIPKGAILCFVGPPGVGKTSLGKSIARALGRRFVRISLGGVRDEAEIRGHRRTYIGAMSGRIIQGIKQSGSKNPVFMLDEVDKLAYDFRGDPASALLEVLDPEQNKEFTDHYIGMPFDLSLVFFICTANITETIPPPLLDRMEIIRIPGYSELDKLKIARKYFIPKAKDETGLSNYEISFTDEALTKIIRLYTREAGLRELERKLLSICRKISYLISKGDEKRKSFNISQIDVSKYLGPPIYPEAEEEIKGAEIGVATGLAWTPFGGDTLRIEVSIVKGKGKISLTGSLGEVMKESAYAAITWIKSNANKFGIKPSTFDQTDVHIHVPEGAVPKDGPSAGIAIATAVLSGLSKNPVYKSVAMTGEITLRGRVLPVGGIREKVLAAARYGITKIIIPKANKKDLDKLPQEIKLKTQFFPISGLEEALKISLKYDKKPKQKRNR